MSNFKLHHWETPVHSERKIFSLEVDGRVPFYVFQQDMQKAGKKKDLLKILALLEDLALGLGLPPKACKPVKGRADEDDWPEFELVKNQLRIYFFIIPPHDSVVVMGEFKKSNKQQRLSISKFQSIKSAFKAHYLNLTDHEL